MTIEVLDNMAKIIGYSVMISSGLLVAGISFMWAASLAGRQVWATFDHLRSIYRLEVIKYWFPRIGKSGWKVPSDDEIAATPAQGEK